jgi:WD40 repeat protein
MMQTRMIRFLVWAAEVVAGISAPGYPGQAAGPPPRPAPPEPAAAAGVGGKPRLDWHGDPLPDGALLRLGTLRWRVPGSMKPPPDSSDDGGVKGLVFAPDGRTMAAALHDRVCLLDPDGRLTRQMQLGKDRYSPPRHLPLLAFSPDGKRLACGCRVRDARSERKSVVKIQDLSKEDKMREFLADDLVWLGWSAGGEPLAVLWSREALLVRELASGKERRLEVATRHPADCCLSYAGQARQLAVADDRHRIHFWDISTGQKVHTLDPQAEYVFDLLVSPDGHTLVSVAVPRGKERCDLRVWDVRTGKLRFTLPWPEKAAINVEFSPDSQTLAVPADQPGVVRFLDPATGRERARTRHPNGALRKVAFTPDSGTLATALAASEAIQFQDSSTGSLQRAQAGHVCVPTSIAISPDGKKAATLGGSDPILVWGLTIGDLMNRLERETSGEACAFSSDGRALSSFSRRGTLDFTDIRTGRLLHALTPSNAGGRAGSRCLDVRLSGDGKTVVAFTEAESERGDLWITGWDVTTRKQIFQRPSPNEVRLGTLISFRGARPGTVIPFVDTPETEMLPVPQLGWKPGDDHLFRGFIRLERLSTGERLFDFPTFPGITLPRAFSADGRFLATLTVSLNPDGKGGQESRRLISTIRIWELATREEGLALALSKDPHPMAFSADLRWLALTGDDGSEILLHDLQGGRPPRRFRGSGSRVSCLAFTSDGHRLLSGQEDTTLLVWDIRIPPRAKVPAPDPATLARAWDDLAGTAKRAFAARGLLAQAPTESVRLLNERLKPIREVDDRVLRQLIADLDSEAFAVCQQASARLQVLGERAAPSLREALERKPSLEARRRIEALLARLPDPIENPEVRRAVRAIAVLEAIGTPEARAVLKTLAGGAVAARQTQEARKALDRASRGQK